MRVALASVVFGWLPLAAAEDLAAELQSQDRRVRFAAIVRACDLQTIPDSLVVPILESLRLEGVARKEVPGLPRKTAPQRIDNPTKLPRVGNEIGLAKVKANPRDFLNKQFPIIGFARLSDYWNYGYSDLEETHYSIRIVEIDETDEGPTEGESAHLYLRRDNPGARQLADYLTENGKGNIHTAIRATVTLPSTRYEGADQWDLLTLIEFQLLSDDRTTWEPLRNEAYEKLTALVDEHYQQFAPEIIAAVSLPPTTNLDSDWHSILMARLVGMETSARRAALSELREAVKLEKDKETKEHLRQVIAELSSSLKKAPPGRRSRG